MEAKKFSKIDKEFVKIMTKAVDTRVVTQCCANEYLVNTLPMLYSELEKCQKALDGYLDQKRGKFPRFYFCSSPVLLQILSQGSDPLNMQKFYEKVFDSISAVVHDPKDKTRITGFLYRKGTTTEVIDLVRVVNAKGNIEDWLYDLLKAQQETVKKLAGECAFGAMDVTDIESQLRGFVDAFPAQFALMGIQMMWTADCQEALENCTSKKSIMKETSKKQNRLLNELSSWTLTDLAADPKIGKLNRTKIECMIIVHVHQRDVMSDLLSLYNSKKLRSANDFEWQKQARFQWKPDQNDLITGDGSMV